MPVLADDQAELIGPEVVINEIQTNGLGTGTTDQEFVELKNIGGQAADISGWKLQYVPSTGNLANAKYFFVFPANTVIYAGGYLLVSANSYLAELIPRLEYTVNSGFTGLAATGATVRLANAIDIVLDTVGWGTAVIYEGNVAPAPDKGTSIQRKITGGKTTDSDDNFTDFEMLAIHDPQTENTNPTPSPEPTPTPEPSIEPTPEPSAEPTIEPTIEPIMEPSPEPTPTPIPEPTPLPILLNELYIDPASPQTDDQDEWVEVYNPNNEPVDLLGYSIFTGATFSYKHIFSASVTIDALGYAIITSGESSLSLSNSSGAAKIVGPDGQIFDQTTYLSAKEGLAWAKNENNEWLWTTTPTQEMTNLITSLPEPIKKAAAAASVQKSVSSSKKAAATPKPSPTPKAVTKVKAATSTSGDVVDLVAAPSPLPVWLLAILGVLALLYALYEYRFELSNKLYQFRQYRENRGSGR